MVSNIWFSAFLMAAVPGTVNLYQHLLYQAVLALHNPYGLRNFGDPENARYIFSSYEIVLS